MFAKTGWTGGTRWGAVFGAALLASSLAVGCSDDDDDTQDAGVDATMDASVMAAIPVEIPCTDDFDAVYGDPGTLPGTKGAVLKCSTGEPMSRETIQEEIDALGYNGDAMTSGAQLYRVTYETQRGNDDPGYSSALVLIPETPRAETLPLIIASHGSVGQAPLCAPSRMDPASEYSRDDFYRQMLPLVGAGYAVIAPDLAGYANFGAAGNPPSAYAHALDTARSTLDAAAAMRHLVGSHLNTSVVLTGHSQGGHTALSALALESTYGVDGTIEAVVLYAPLWINPKLAGAMLLAPESFTLAEDKTFVSVGVWYHYTHSTLMDPGNELEVFAPTAHAAVTDLVNNACWAPTYPGLNAVATDIGDLFTADYASVIGLSAALNGPCNGNALCEKWMGYFAADRPHLTGAATQVPILFSYGLQDPTLSPGYMGCVIERLVTHDGANVTGCIQSGDDHNTIVSHTSSYVNQWIGSQVLGETAPAACSQDLSSYVTEEGTMLVECQQPPPND